MFVSLLLMLSSEFLQANHSSKSFPFEVCNLLLGKGGSGQVFLGRVSNSDNYVAIKKRFVKPDGNGAKRNGLSSKGSEMPDSPHVPAIQGTQSALLLTFSGCPFASGDPKLRCPTECHDSGPIPQRREFDLGEESVSQVTALSQQSNKPLLVLGDANAPATTVSPRSLADEVSVLRYLGPHPQIVRFMGNYTTSRCVSFFTMELMDSDVARELKESNQSFRNESVCVATAYSVLKALEYMHARGVAHRDVKPGNILLKKLTFHENWPCVRLLLPDSSSTLQEQQKLNTEATRDDAAPYVKAALGDFSAARGVFGVDETAYADTRGTLHYKAPEQLMGRRGTVLDNFTAVDLWGLGCTMYEMVVGTRPFPGSSELQVLMSILDLMGSDIQSFPTATRTARLFDNVSASAPFVSLLRSLLSLNPSVRPTASEVLQHPVFEALRRADAHFSDSQETHHSRSTLHIIGIPLALKYAPFTHIPQLRFSRISRTPRIAPQPAPDVRNAADAPYFSYVTSQLTAEDEVAALSALTHYAQKAQTASHRDAVVRGEGENGAYIQARVADDEESAVRAESAQLRSPDATMTSFMSESSYLHWSEIRPMAQPRALTAPQAHRPTLHSTDTLDQSASGRVAAALLGANAGSTPSPSTGNVTGQHRQSSESSRHPSASMHRSTVARALNISDSSVKLARTERSISHVDFDLSPVTATQLFGAEADLGTCLVPHTGVATIPRPPLPVLQLKSGSTFTASNLRANSSFEHDGNAVHGGSAAAVATIAARGTTGNTLSSSSFSTPRESALLRTTAYAGRALCFSEETDRFARCSTGSCPSQPSYLSSLLTSPALLNGAHEGSSPHPSPICPLATVARSPSGLPIVERSGLSSDDSGIGCGWAGMGLGTGAGSNTTADTSVSAVTVALPPFNADERRAPMLRAARAKPHLSVGGAAVGVVSTSLLSESPHTRRCLPRSVAQDSAKLPPPAPSSSSSATFGPPPPPPTTMMTACVNTTASAHSSDGSGDNRDNNTPAVPVAMPLPIPLSVAAGSQTSSSSSGALSASSSALPQTTTPRVIRVSSRRRSGSAAVAVPSVSPDDLMHHTCSAPMMLRDHDINVPASVFDPTQRSTTKPALTAPSSSPYKPVTVPPCPAAIVAVRSQRHCTPSSTEPGQEASVAVGSHVRQLTLTQPHSSVLFTEAPSLQLVGSPTPRNSREAAATTVPAGGGQLCGGETLSASTPHSGARSLYKRSRDEISSNEECNAIGEHLC